MKDKRYMMLGLALALAGVMLLAGLAMAQNQGGGGAKAGQGGQLCTPGSGGTCAVPPAVGQGNPNCPAPGAGKAQKRRGSRGPQGGKRANQPDPQANPPAAGQ